MPLCIIEFPMCIQSFQTGSGCRRRRHRVHCFQWKHRGSHAAKGLILLVSVFPEWHTSSPSENRQINEEKQYRCSISFISNNNLLFLAARDQRWIAADYGVQAGSRTSSSSTDNQPLSASTFPHLDSKRSNWGDILRFDFLNSPSF